MEKGALLCQSHIRESEKHIDCKKIAKVSICIVSSGEGGSINLPQYGCIV